MTSWWQALMGGVLIGVSVSLMLLLNGRVTGVSGIVGGLLDFARKDRSWRVAFVLGLICGGLALSMLNPSVFSGVLSTPIWTVAVAGLLVGFGTDLGSGCTSGHGVCGVSRLSRRSIVATMTFILSGIFAVHLLRLLGWL